MINQSKNQTNEDTVTHLEKCLEQQGQCRE